MTVLEQKVDALAELIMAQDKGEAEKARKKLKQLMAEEYVAECTGVVYRDCEYVIRQILLELGAQDHLLGHRYVVEAVKLVLSNRVLMDNITLGLYPTIAAKYDTDTARVERAVRHLIEKTWDEGDPDILTKYFGNTISPNKGKPTNGQFIARMANIVKEKMRAGRT